jgi:hypothetical protein
VTASDRRAASRRHFVDEATVRPPARGPCEHGIDMSLRTPDRDRTFGGLTGFWRSLLCFQEAGLRRARPAPLAAGRPCRSDTHSIRGRERPVVSSVGVKRLHRSGPHMSGIPACGATDETTGGRDACQTGQQAQHPPHPKPSRAPSAGATYRRRVTER